MRLIAQCGQCARNVLAPDLGTGDDRLSTRFSDSPRGIRYLELSWRPAFSRAGLVLLLNRAGQLLDTITESKCSLSQMMLLRETEV
jgi:hypothetical protein